MSRGTLRLWLTLITASVALHSPLHASSVPFWGAHQSVDAQALARLQIPAEFVGRVNSILEPGATVLVTDEPLSSLTNGTPVQIADADPPNARHRS